MKRMREGKASTVQTIVILGVLMMIMEGSEKLKTVQTDRRTLQWETKRRMLFGLKMFRTKNNFITKRNWAEKKEKIWKKYERERKKM